MTIVVLLAAGLAAGTTACSSTPVDTATTKTTASPSPTVAPTPVVETRAYTMADGSTVDVDPTQSLPAAVLAEIKAPSQAADLLVSAVPGTAVLAAR